MGRQSSRALVAGLLVGVSIWGCSDDDGGSAPGELAGEAGSPAAGAHVAGMAGMAEGGVGGRVVGGAGGVSGAVIVGGQPERAGQSGGGAGGEGGESSGLPPLEWCDGVDQSGLSLDALCGEQDCPTLVTPSTGPSYYANLETYCLLDPRSDSNPSSAKRYGSTCGGFALDLPYPEGRIIWHFDESHALVAAEIRLLNYDRTPCHTEKYGRSCETTGPAVNVCDPDSHCAEPLTAIDQPTRQQVLCSLLCDGTSGYRIPNDCGGMNYVRHDGRVDPVVGDDPDAFTRTWSFDAQNQLVGAYGRGFGFSGFCADGTWALGVTYGEPCQALDPYAYGSSAYDVCRGVGPYSDQANGEGGAGGAGDESRYWTNGSAPLEDAELCAVDCAPTDLATYCSAAGSYCPHVNVDGYGVEAACGDTTGTTVGDASCGHVIDALGDGKTRVYYFDDEWQLVGAKLAEEPRRLGTYCKTQVVGEQCTPEGAPLDICWTAGCLPPSHQVTPFPDLSQCNSADRRQQVPNDCGGINITSSIPGERGSDFLYSYDADHNWLGTRSFFVEDGYGLHDCAEGGIGAGYLDGTLCKSVGDSTPLCP